MSFGFKRNALVHSNPNERRERIRAPDIPTVRLCGQEIFDPMFERLERDANDTELYATLPCYVGDSQGFEEGTE